MKKIFMTFTALSTSMVLNMAYAATPDCDTVNTTEKCADMGYVLTKTNCGCDDSGNNCSYPTLKCPFDDSKVYCYRSKSKVCEAGDILFDDKRCYYDLDKVPEGVMPKAVVFDPENKLAVELEGGSMVPAVRTREQDLLHSTTITNSTYKIVEPFYKINPTDLYQKETKEVPSTVKFPGVAQKLDTSGAPQSFQLKYEKVKMDLPTAVLINNTTTEYSIGTPAPNVNTLIDYDSCECNYNARTEFQLSGAALKNKKFNLVETPKEFFKKMVDLKDSNNGEGPAYNSIKPFSGLTVEDIKIQTTAFEPYIDASGTQKLLRFEDYKLGSEIFKPLSSDCAQVQRCKQAALDYRSTQKSVGGYADTRKLYEWAKDNQNKIISERPATQAEREAAGCYGRFCTGTFTTRGTKVETAAATRCMMMNRDRLNPSTLASYEYSHDVTMCGNTCTIMGSLTGADGPDTTIYQMAFDFGGWGSTYYDPAGNYWFLPSIGDLGVLGDNIEKVNAGLAAAARFVAKYNYDPKHSSNKQDIKVNLIGINTPTIMKAISGGTNPLLTANPATLKTELKAIGAKIRAAKSFEDMEYINAASGLLPIRLRYDSLDVRSGSTEITNTRTFFNDVKDVLKNWIGTNKQVNKPALLINTGTKKYSFLSNESLWASTMGYTIDDYTGPSDVSPYNEVTKKGIKNYDYTWFYRPLPRTGEAKFGVAQSWQTGDADRPRNVRCVYYYGADTDDWSSDSAYNSGAGYGKINPLDDGGFNPGLNPGLLD